MPNAPLPLTVQIIEKFTVVEFHGPSLMEQLQLEAITAELTRLVKEEDRRRIVLDFEKITFISSQAIGMLMLMNKLTKSMPHGQLVLCGVGPKLLELLKIIRLDKLLTIKPSQREAVKVFV
jgi:anti-anti-sigma factor